MPYLRVDLDGKKKWPFIAQGLGIDRAFVAQGFLDLWETCWNAKSDVVSLLQLECLFRAHGEKVGPILCEFGFLERLEDGRWRVKGFTAYLALSNVRSAAGKKGGQRTAKSLKGARNLRQNTEAIASAEPSKTEATAEATPKPLHLYTHTPNHPSIKQLQQRPQKAVGHVSVKKPDTPRAGWGSTEFQQWCQFLRQQDGFPPEEPIPIGEVEQWWRVVMEWADMDVTPLCEGFLAFGQDKYWEGQGFPFRAFMSQWKKFCRKERKVVSI